MFKSLKYLGVVLLLMGMVGCQTSQAAEAQIAILQGQRDSLQFEKVELVADVSELQTQVDQLSTSGSASADEILVMQTQLNLLKRQIEAADHMDGLLATQQDEIRATDTKNQITGWAGIASAALGSGVLGAIGLQRWTPSRGAGEIQTLRNEVSKWQGWAQALEAGMRNPVQLPPMPPQPPLSDA